MGFLKRGVPGPTFGVGKKTGTTTTVGGAWNNRWAGSKDNIWNRRNPMDPWDSGLKDVLQDWLNLKDSDLYPPEKTLPAPIDLSRGPIVQGLSGPKFAQGAAPRFSQVQSSLGPTGITAILAALGK